MKEQIISFDTAKLAKEKGIFNADTFSFYNKNGQFVLNPIYFADIEELKEEDLAKDHYLAHTQSLLQKILREKYDIHILIEPVVEEITNRSLYEMTVIWDGFKDNTGIDYTGGTYEEALEEGLQEGLKLISD